MITDASQTASAVASAAVSPHIDIDHALAIARGVYLVSAEIDALTGAAANGDDRDRAGMGRYAERFGTFGKIALAHPDLKDTPIDLDLRNVAPRLLDRLTGQCVNGESIWAGAAAESEFAWAVETFIGMQTAVAERRPPDDPIAHNAEIAQLTQVLDSGCERAVVPAVSSLTAICHLWEVNRAECGELSRPDALKWTFGDYPLGRVEWDDAEETHLRGHREFARSWRLLRAYLDARLDALGRQLTPTQLRALAAVEETTTSTEGARTT